MNALATRKDMFEERRVPLWLEAAAVHGRADLDEGYDHVTPPSG